MSKQIKVTPSENNKEPAVLTDDELFQIVENNRGRIRIFSNAIITICGLFISTSFAIFFFVLEKQILQSNMKIVLLKFGR